MACKNFSIVRRRRSIDVKRGDFGGLIKSENNLSHEGNCWVSDDAKVFCKAKVYGEAWICDSAKVYGNAKVYDNAVVCGGARVYKGAQVYEFA